MSNGEIFRRRNVPHWDVGGHVGNVPPQPSGTDSKLDFCPFPKGSKGGASVV